MKVTKKQWGRLRQASYLTADAAVGVLLVLGLVDGRESAAFLLLANAALTMAFFKVDLGDETEADPYRDDLLIEPHRKI